MSSGTRRWRWSVKTALATAIATIHDRGLPPRRAGRPLVLGYHRVVEDFEEAARTEMASMLISTAMFERHLDCIGKDFDFVSVDEIGARVAEGRPFDKPVAAVTFDDGYRDVYEHALPILRRKGIPAAMFVVTDLIDRTLWQAHDRLYHLVAKAFMTWPDPRRELVALLENLGLSDGATARSRVDTRSPLLATSTLLPGLSLKDVHRVMDALEARVGDAYYSAIPETVGWAELRDMRRQGFTVGSHTRNHVSLPMECPAVMTDQLTESRRQLEAGLGEPIEHFAYPGGQFNSAVVDAVADAGYKYAYTACQHNDDRHRALTIERLLLWERSSVDADGAFAPAILNCQAQDLWPPSRTCDRLHQERAVHG